MAVTYADILQPIGEIEPELFPHIKVLGDLQARITQYLAEGATKAADLAIPAASVDEATLHWGYYRAYLAVYQRLIATPAEARNDGQGSRKYEGRQAEAFLELANQHKDIFDGLVPPATATTVGRDSASFRHRLAW